jgi:predicted DNA-binding transcriptional regulator YafY
MATNKHASIRYQALDKCFRNFGRRYNIEDLIEACNQAIYEYTGVEDGIKRRSVYVDIAYMESEQGWNIPLERIKDGRNVYFRYEDKNYSINSKPLTDYEMDQLKETVLMLNRFKGLPQFAWMEELLSKLEAKFHLKGKTENLIGFEQNPYLTGIDFLSDLFNAIVSKQTLKVEYKSFDKPVVNLIIHPYYIKQFNNRWFLFGLNGEYGTVQNLPLDRIISIQSANEHYIENKDIDFDEFFDDVIGVTIPRDGKLEHITLQFSPERLQYVLSKPLHPSQKIKDKQKGIIEISVIPNKELESLILSFGNQVEVISPKHYREQIYHQITDLITKYSSVQNECTNS